MKGDSAPPEAPAQTMAELQAELESVERYNKETQVLIFDRLSRIKTLKEQAERETPESKKWKDNLRKKFDSSCGRGGVMDINEFAMALGKRGRNGKTQPLEKGIASLIFRAVDKNGNGEVDKNEFVATMTRLNAGTLEDRADVFFQILDENKDRTVSRDEFLEFLRLSMKHNHLKDAEGTNDDDIEAVVDTIFRGNFQMNRDEFTENVANQNSELLMNLQFGGLSSARSSSDPEDSEQEQPALSRFWRFAINNRKRIFLTILITALCTWAFVYKWQEYESGTKFDLMGYTLPLAKGCADVMKVCLIFIMIFMCRRFITRWRGSWIGKYVIEFDDAIMIHKATAVVFFVAMWVHVVAHVINVENIVDPNNYELWRKAYPDKGTTQETRWEVYTTLIAMTGILLTVGFTIVFFFALEWPRTLDCIRNTSFGRFANNFNVFWGTHHIVFLCFILLVIHPLPGMCWDPCDSDDTYHGDTWQWLLLPVSIYLAERLHRYWKESHSLRPRVLLAKVKPGNVLQLRMTKPAAWDHGKDRVRAGMYCFIKCQDISGFEWHPFTLTSAPHDKFMEVHIRGLGDWTKALIKKFDEAEKAQALIEEKIKNGEVEDSMRAMGLPAVVWPAMGLEGPFGAPAQGYENFKVLMLVGAGIGVTPFASILSEIANRFQELQCPNCSEINYQNFPIKKVYFYFMSRDQKEFSWFKDTLESIVLADNQCRIECHQYITSVESESDIRSAAIKMVQKAAIGMGKDDDGVRISKGGTEIEMQDPDEELLLKGDPGTQDDEEAPKTSIAGKDFLTGMESNIPLHFGRPEWPKIFKQVKKQNPDEEIGVFFCGAPIIGKALDQCSDTFSDTISGRKEFMNEHGEMDTSQEGTNFVYHEEHF